MKVEGMMLVFADVPGGREKELEFNRWYDLDHVPEVLTAPCMISGRRYHATDDLMQYRADKLPNAPSIGQARYAAVYLVNGDLERVLAQMTAVGDRLRPLGRSMPHGKAVHVSVHRLMKTFVAPRIPVAPEAVPFLPHLGLQVAMGHVPDPKDIAEASAWWDDCHYPDMLGVPGWAAAMKFEPVGKEGQGRFTHLFYLDRPAREAHEELDKALPAMRAAGRSPHPRGIYKRVFSGPLSPIRPLEYDFL